MQEIINKSTIPKRGRSEYKAADVSQSSRRVVGKGDGYKIMMVLFSVKSIAYMPTSNYRLTLGSNKKPHSNATYSTHTIGIYIVHAYTRI